MLIAPWALAFYSAGARNETQRRTGNPFIIVSNLTIAIVHVAGRGGSLQ